VPLHDYRCLKCSHVFEVLILRMDKLPAVACEKCAGDTERQISSFQVGPVVGSGDVYKHLTLPGEEPFRFKSGSRKEQKAELRREAAKRFPTEKGWDVT
jgi:putative FmdB family regulatory protein